MTVLPGVLGYRTLRRTVQVRLGFDFGFRISDLGFFTTIDNIELNSSDFAICSLVLTNFSANFQSAIRIPQSSTRWHSHLHGLGTPIHEISGLGVYGWEVGMEQRDFRYVVPPHHRPVRRSRAGPSDHQRHLDPRPWPVLVFLRSLYEPWRQNLPQCFPFSKQRER